jgi:hypothetical protein
MQTKPNVDVDRGAFPHHRLKFIVRSPIRAPLGHPGGWDRYF